MNMAENCQCCQKGCNYGNSNRHNRKNKRFWRAENKKKDYNHKKKGNGCDKWNFFWSGCGTFVAVKRCSRKDKFRWWHIFIRNPGIHFFLQKFVISRWIQHIFVQNITKIRTNLINFSDSVWFACKSGTFFAEYSANHNIPDSVFLRRQYTVFYSHCCARIL